MSKVFALASHLRLPGVAAALFFVTSFAHAATPPPPAPAYHPPDYFFTVNLDPRYQFSGTGALTEEDAAKANCYRFLYNSSGKLEEIEYRRAGILMPDPLLGVARIDFEYAPGIERRWFRDAQGQPVRDIDGIYGEELTLNPSGFPTAVTNLDDSGGHIRDNSSVLQYVRTLDEHNRLIVGRRMGLFGTPITDDSGFYETRTTYDAQGQIVERSNYDASGNLLNNNDGFAQVRTIYTIYPDSTQIIESYFDTSSLPVEEKSDGVHQLQRTLDKRGFTLDEAYFDTTGAPTVTSDNGIHERRYTYDDRGNQITEEFFDVNGRPTDQKGATNNLDYAKVIYKYDDKNRVIEKAFFGDDGTPQVNPSVGAAIIRQEYNKHGDLVRRQFFDGLRHPKAHTQYGAPAIRIKVEGDTTFVTLRNGDDRPIKNPVSGYYGFSYKTLTDHPLSLTNTYYDRHGREMSRLRVCIINPHLFALNTTPLMKWSARVGAAAAGFGSLLACWLALKKSSHTKRRKVYVPTPLERFLGWFAVLALLDGILCFFLTLYWAWVSYANGRVSFLEMVGYNSQLAAAWTRYQNSPLDYGVYILETIFLLFMLYRLNRLRHTMRVLNIEREDIHRLVKEFFAKVGLNPEWNESSHHYVTPPLDVRVNYFLQKFHAYLAFRGRGEKGHEFARDAAVYIRAQAGGILAPVRTRAIAFYYPSVALCYFLLACIAFYTLYQLIKGY